MLSFTLEGTLWRCTPAGRGFWPERVPTEPRRHRASMHRLNGEDTVTPSASRSGRGHGQDRSEAGPAGLPGPREPRRKADGRRSRAPSGRPAAELQEKRRREIQRQSDATDRIQAWWRGTLVRRTLLVAALRAWIIQLWWRRLLWRRGCGLRQGLLQIYAVEELGAVRLQSWFRMWQCHRAYCQMRGTICLSGDPESCFRFQIQEPPRAPRAPRAPQNPQDPQAPQDPRDPQDRQAPQAQRMGAAKDLEFRVEILTI
ncbi:hypothetical protein QTO34_007323 [Cnephaeus nilssonii]|uniref:IQ domain-containing protein F3 n=1 Tax=Cnephaeus nilssonii TaxID=3371016 RepID=A0AA40LH69_CNENI|nr:hypothetical protein QTO34_007323 [Eptesicus nilssonii]